MIDIIDFIMNKMTTAQGRAGAERASKMPVTAIAEVLTDSSQLKALELSFLIRSRRVGSVFFLAVQSVFLRALPEKVILQAVENNALFFIRNSIFFGQEPQGWPRNQKICVLRDLT